MSRDVDECFKDKYEPDNAGLPPKKNRNLPFLAYGFFKPHQIAYSQIKDYVKGTPKKVDVYYELKNVNWMPVLLNKPSNSPAQAYIIDIEPDRQYDAYEKIGRSKNKHVYSWNVITVETKDGQSQDVNVLFYPPGEKFPKKAYEFRDNNYDWRDDPVFDATLNYLDWQIDLLKTNPPEYKWNNLNWIIGVQSLYMTLWSAIDRFMSFRYGSTQAWNVNLLSLEPSFEKNLPTNRNAIGKKSFYKNMTRDEKNKENYKIFSTKDLNEYKLNSDKSTCSALYYYNLRNNVIHSSKANPEEADIVWNALIGLTKIFKNVLKEVKKE